MQQYIQSIQPTQKTASGKVLNQVGAPPLRHGPGQVRRCWQSAESSWQTAAGDRSLRSRGVHAPPRQAIQQFLYLKKTHGARPMSFPHLWFFQQKSDFRRLPGTGAALRAAPKKINFLCKIIAGFILFPTDFYFVQFYFFVVFF